MKIWNDFKPSERLLSLLVVAIFGVLQTIEAQSVASGLVSQELTQEYLKSKTPAQWAELAMARGDAIRGVNVFYQNNLACVRCHLPSADPTRPLGPTLGHAREIATAETLSVVLRVESSGV
ncbi:MAG: hypothetical protein ACK42H_20215, partial [Planctomycetota bacterium]